MSIEYYEIIERDVAKYYIIINLLITTHNFYQISKTSLHKIRLCERNAQHKNQ